MPDAAEQYGHLTGGARSTSSVAVPSFIFTVTFQGDSVVGCEWDTRVTMYA